MQIRKHSWKVLAGAATILATTAATMVTGADAHQAAPAPSITVTPWLTNLNAPRGIAFDGAGNFYVAESGVAGPDDQGMTRSGRVKKFELGSSTALWRKRFDSLYAHEAPPPAPADVLGPEGMGALRAGCAAPKPRSVRDCQPRMIMSESTLGTGAPSDQIGRLYRFNRRTGRHVMLSNVGNQQWRWTKRHANPAEPEPDSNPYAVLVARFPSGVRTFVVDAGANTLAEVMPNGRTRVVALIPNDTPEHDAAPTCVAKGPDGMLYVGTLDLIVNQFGNDPGHSNVWRVNPDARYPTKPKVWASGLTTITACTFDRAGNFWAAEMFAPNESGPPGDIVRIPFHRPMHQTHLGLGELPLPGGIVQGPGKALYVSVNSAAPGPAGAVMRVVLN